MTRSERRTWYPVAAGLLLFLSSTSLWAVKTMAINYTTHGTTGCVESIDVADTKYKQLNQKMTWQLIHESGGDPQPGVWSIVEKSSAPFSFCGTDPPSFDANGEASCRAKDANMPSFRYSVEWVPTTPNPEGCDPIELDPAIIFDEPGGLAILDSLTFYRVLTVVLLLALVVAIGMLRRRQD